MAISRASNSSIQGGLPKFNDIWDGTTATSAFDSLGAVVVSSSTSSITFSNIPQTYTHLQIRYIARTDYATAGADFLYSINGVTTNASYAYHRLGGEGSVAFSQSSTSSRIVGINNGSSAGANMFASGIMDILDYTNTNKNRTVRNFVGSDRNGSGIVAIYSNLYISTTTVTSISLITENGNWITGSSFSLYGIK